jgi:hypothetical protein
METIKTKDGSFHIEIRRWEIDLYKALGSSNEKVFISESDKNPENLGKKVREEIDKIINERNIVDVFDKKIDHPLFKIVFEKGNYINYKPSFGPGGTIWEELQREEIGLFWKGFKSVK